MRYLVAIARWFVGILFIISGLIKLNDPVGFSFKLEEYFSPAVLDLNFLMPYALAIALFVVIFEVLLGILLLIGFRMKFTLWSLLLMIVFFTFLTFYSAYFNKVTDCGCFGDAIKLTPWESFAKDVVLLLLILLLFFKQDLMQPLFGKRARQITFGVSLVACILFANYVLNHLPVIDFRPYKVGANIEEGMQVPEDAPKAVFEYAWKFQQGGQEKVVVTRGDYPQVEGEFVGVETTQLQAGYEPPIHDFTIEQEGQDMAAAFLQAPKLMMVVAYDLGKTEEEVYPALAAVIDKARAQDYEVIGMSASDPTTARDLVQKYQLDLEFYFTDQTTLKTIVRSNPGVLLLREGTIIQKVHYNDLDQLIFN